MPSPTRGHVWWGGAQLESIEDLHHRCRAADVHNYHVDSYRHHLLDPPKNEVYIYIQVPGSNESEKNKYVKQTRFERSQQKKKEKKKATTMGLEPTTSDYISQMDRRSARYHCAMQPVRLIAGSPAATRCAQLR